MRLYCMYDEIAEVYAPPFVAKNDKDAQRLMSAIKYPEGSNPDDYSLLFLLEIAEVPKQEISAVYRRISG